MPHMPAIDVDPPKQPTGHVLASAPCSVLFARADSIYKELGCDVWDAERDATKWPGGNQVIAHPPCRAWSALAHMAKPRPGEKDYARWSVKMVRRWGGVLEHPASSRLWADQNLPRPIERDEYGGFTVAMPQWWFGHRADKPTRFYVCGCEPKDLPEVPLVLGEAPCVVTTSKRKCETPPEEWRERLGNREKEATPRAMAEWLIAVATICRPNVQRLATEPVPTNIES